MNRLEMPPETLRYILYQRTNYLKGSVLIRVADTALKHFLSYETRMALLSRLFKRNVENCFALDMHNEYQSIKSYLPLKAASVLDIGCGVAGIDVFLSRHYSDKLQIYLLDKTATEDKIFYGFKKRGAFYNSLPLAVKLLELNGVKKKNILTQEVTIENEITVGSSFDIVISLISWGFHYPVSTYLEEVQEKLSKHGVLIIDIRKDTSGLKDIRNAFSNVSVILDRPKFVRVAASNS